MQWRGMLKKPPRVRDNNGAFQVRLRPDGRDYFINCVGRFDDPVAQARGQAICAEIWRDAQQGDLDVAESIPPIGRGTRPGFARCPQVIGRGEEAGKGDACLSGGEAVWLADQDQS